MHPPASGNIPGDVGGEQTFLYEQDGGNVVAHPMIVPTGGAGEPDGGAHTASNWSTAG